jgi:hypothetical protein
MKINFKDYFVVHPKVQIKEAENIWELRKMYQTGKILRVGKLIDVAFDAGYNAAMMKMTEEQVEAEKDLLKNSSIKISLKR